MNKAELINAVAEKAALSKKDSEAAVNAALEAITGALSDGEKVQLVGFGSFEVKKREARVAAIPRPRRPLRSPPPRFPCSRPQGPEGRRGQVKTFLQSDFSWARRNGRAHSIFTKENNMRLDKYLKVSR